ncbi:MAG: phosphatidylglycerophosphatase A [Nitrospirae bacterium]|nr:phosphatidylglycerophosphatase A [Nitrospirota bacterium]
MKTILKHVATLWFVGYIPLAPGTFGSLVPFMAVYAFGLTNKTVVTSAIVLFFVGIVAASVAEKESGKKDPGHVVIDEVVGYLVAISYLDHKFMILFLAFLLFRLFDIWKPPPVNYFECKFSGGTGIMLDDVAAGIYVNIIFQIATRMYF